MDPQSPEAMPVMLEASARGFDIRYVRGMRGYRDGQVGGAAMKTCPSVGTRVGVKAGLTHGAYTGTVTAIYPAYKYDEINDRETNEPLPEQDWHVGVRVDKIPKHWPYQDATIAPQVKKLRAVKP